MIISPPDMVLEAGNSSTVARRNVPPANSRAAFGSRSSLNFVHRFLRPGRIESLRNRDNWSRLDVSLAFGKGVEHVLRQIEVGSQDVFRRHVDQSVIETVPCLRTRRCQTTAAATQKRQRSPCWTVSLAGPILYGTDDITAFRAIDYPPGAGRYLDFERRVHPPLTNSMWRLHHGHPIVRLV